MQDTKVFHSILPIWETSNILPIFSDSPNIPPTLPTGQQNVETHDRNSMENCRENLHPLNNSPDIPRNMTRDTPLAILLQILAMSTGKDMRLIPENACIKAVEGDFSREGLEYYVQGHFTALLRKLHQAHPKFAD